MLQPFVWSLKQLVFDRTLGKGAFGTVYLAHHAKNSRKKYAVKVLDVAFVHAHKLAQQVCRYYQSTG